MLYDTMWGLALAIALAGTALAIDYVLSSVGARELLSSCGSSASIAHEYARRWLANGCSDPLLARPTAASLAEADSDDGSSADEDDSSGEVYHWCPGPRVFANVYVSAIYVIYEEDEFHGPYMFTLKVEDALRELDCCVTPLELAKFFGYEPATQSSLSNARMWFHYYEQPQAQEKRVAYMLHTSFLFPPEEPRQ
ncbi:MAG: hypothetical protein KGL42_13645 [Betaproteobacteria bacterium]|nr:hypothetical protein [Betaproteobacteria bacterium]